jgi:hypothetical protein
MDKEIEIVIKPDGTVDIDLIGYEGNACDIDLKKIADSIGEIQDSSKKQDFYKKVNINVKSNNKRN